LIKSVPQIINLLSLTENADHKAHFNGIIKENDSEG
jgi:hypothetical protein